MTNSLITRLEEISLNALPALQTLSYDGWILRLSNGYSRRANSVQPLYPSTLPLEEKLAYCESIYRASNLPPTFKMTSAALPETLDAVLETRGYTAEGHTCVQTCTLDKPSRFLETSKVSNALKARISEQWDDEWFHSYCRLSEAAPARRETLRRMLQLIVPQTGFALVLDDGKPVACGLGVCEGAYVGLFDIVVDAQVRRRGLGTQLVTQLMQWGQQNGADTCYLQVVKTNSPAQQLYAGLGFVEQYRYWYRVRA